MSDPLIAPPNEKDLLLATMDLPTDQRSDYLNKACGSDIKLKARVKELMKNAETGGSFMAQPAVDLNPTTVLSSIKIGGQIGRYRLMEQLGEGGMGIVYVAEQVEPVRRKVALKVIKPGMDSKQVIARFEAERQALALMDHTNIARVLDAGTTDQGLPYFVMELVRGLTITQYCDQAKASTHKRLELFIAVCNAVHHAHQKGIIHRDIKPANVLVTLHDGKPVVKVIDFGVAKALHQQLSQHTVYTALNQVMGTPLYMSPEQLELSGLDIDTRTDIYSLGVLLYEILSGTTPFDRERLLKSGFDEMRRIIREEEPPRPSQRITTLPKAELSTVANKRGLDDRSFTQSVQSELDWITMKALEKDRDRRYESSSALGADIQRYLDDEPVLACPPSVAYRAKKLMRRHRVLLTTCMLVVAASLVGTSVSIWQAIRASEAKQVAVASNAIARQAVDDMYTQFAEKWLSEEGNANQLQREFLEKAAAFYEADATQLSNDLTLVIDRLKSRERVCNIQIKLGQHQQAENGLRDLIQCCRKYKTPTPSRIEFAIVELRSTAHLASLLTTIGKSDAATAEYEKAEVQLRELAASQALDASQKADLATVSARLCTSLQEMQLTDASEAAIQTALQLWKELLTADPTDWNHRIGLAKALDRQGVQRMWFGDRNAEAQTVLLESNDMLTQLLKDRPRDRTCRQTLAGNDLNLGVLASWAGQHGQKMELEKQGLEIARGLVQDYPTDQDALSLLTKLQGNHYIVLKKLGTIDEARELLKTYYESSEKLVDLFPSVVDFVSRYCSASNSHSQELFKSGEHSAAVSVANRCRERIELISNESRKDDIDYLGKLENHATINYAALLLEEGHYPDAIRALERLDIDKFVFDPAILTRNTVIDDRFLLNCNDEYVALQSPATLIRECFDLVEKDALLTISSKRELTATLRQIAERCESEAQKWYDAWHDKLDCASLTSEDLLGLYLRFTQESSFTWPADKRLFRETSGRLAMDLVRKFDDLGEDATPGHISFKIGELTAGEEYLRDPELALRLAKRAMEMQPNNGMAEQNLSWALYRNGLYEESLSFQGLKIPRQSATESAVLAMTLWHLGRKEEAAACLDLTYEEQLAAYIARRMNDPKGKNVYPTAANLIRLDREAKALIGDERNALAASFAGAEWKCPSVAPKVQANVDPIESLRAIANWQCDNHRNEAAEESYSELIRLQPDSGDRTVWIQRGFLRIRLKRFEEAISDFNYVLATAPNDTNALVGRFNSNRDLGRFSAALTDATKLIELEPTNYFRSIRRAEIYSKLGQPEEALADIQQGFDVSAGVFKVYYPESEVLALRGQVYLEGLGNSEQAIADFTNALQQNLFSGYAFSKQDVYLLRAAAYDLQGDSEKAEQDRAAAGVKHEPPASRD